tara:strand:+ start:477 stop:734 length:258 start_codon:yes stop_codon:yes gene_type:complete
MTDEKFFDELSCLINDAFDGVFGRKESTPELPKRAPKKEQPKTSSLYESIEDYTAKTGKRFRMTKEQKNLGLTRDEAFSLTFGDN